MAHKKAGGSSRQRPGHGGPTPRHQEVRRRDGDPGQHHRAPAGHQMAPRRERRDRARSHALRAEPAAMYGSRGAAAGKNGRLRRAERVTPRSAVRPAAGRAPRARDPLHAVSRSSQDFMCRVAQGGSGCVSFRRAKNEPRGGARRRRRRRRGARSSPRAVEGLNTLIDFRFRQHVKAGRGEHGQGACRGGARGDDVVLAVPVGTEIFVEPGNCAGRRSCRGRCPRFARARWHRRARQRAIQVIDQSRAAPRRCGGRGRGMLDQAAPQAIGRRRPGWPAQRRQVDVARRRQPGAAQDRRLSLHHPRASPWCRSRGRRGAGARGHSWPDRGRPWRRGAGETGFLGHIERCGVLIHLVDGTQEDVAQAYRTVRAELEAYGHGSRGEARDWSASTRWMRSRRINGA